MTNLSTNLAAVCCNQPDENSQLLRDSHFGITLLFSYFAPLYMKSGKEIYGFSHILAAIAMILALLWLTVSAPVIFSAQQKLVKSSQELSQTIFPKPKKMEAILSGITQRKKPRAGFLLPKSFCMNTSNRSIYLQLPHPCMPSKSMKPIMPITGNSWFLHPTGVDFISR